MSNRTFGSQLRKYTKWMIATTVRTLLFSASTAAWLSLVARSSPQ